jgi:hypothetical protein
MLDPDAGFVVREAVVFTCEVLDCCPWMEFADLEVFLSDDEQDDALSTDPDDFLDSDDSDDGFDGDDEDLFRTLLARYACERIRSLEVVCLRFLISRLFSLAK